MTSERQDLDLSEIDSLIQSLDFVNSDHCDIGWISPVQNRIKHSDSRLQIKVCSQKPQEQRKSSLQLESVSSSLRQELLLERRQLLEQLQALLLMGSETYLTHERRVVEDDWIENLNHTTCGEIKKRISTKYRNELESNEPSQRFDCSNCLKRLKTTHFRSILELYLEKSLQSSQLQ
eukprot:gene1148-1219_t